MEGRAVSATRFGNGQGDSSQGSQVHLAGAASDYRLRLESRLVHNNLQQRLRTIYISLCLVLHKQVDLGVVDIDGR
jgi:hypothetical protein